MILIVSKYLIPKGYSGLTIFPFVIIKTKKRKYLEVLINHEKIHLRQQLEMGILLFFLWYLIEFLVRWIKFKDSYIAYKNICFEREAYLYEKDLNYLEKRCFWFFLKYI